MSRPSSSQPGSTAKATNDGFNARISVPFSTMKMRLLIVEDHAFLRDGLRALLELEPDLEVVGSVGDANAAMLAVRNLQPQLVLTDSALPGRSGIDLIRELSGLAPDLRVVVLTGHSSEEYIRAALNAGADGYVLKESGRSELLHAIRSAAAGRQYLCAAVATKVVSGFVHRYEAKHAVRAEEHVAGREHELLTRIALGQSNKTIARELGLSVKTVEKHRANLMR